MFKIFKKLNKCEPTEEQKRIEYVINVIKSKCNETDYRVIPMDEIMYMCKKVETLNEILRILSVRENLGFFITKSNNLVVGLIY